MVKSKTTLRHLNECSQEEFVLICGPLFEHSPWIARETFAHRPFESLDTLHKALVTTVNAATIDEQVKLIAAHPDLVGRMARQGKLTRESSAEQAAAGLELLDDDEIAAFDHYNAVYRERFGFPFVICARENKKDTILRAFPVRLAQSRPQEIATALTEIGKIARLRLLDAVSET